MHKKDDNKLEIELLKLEYTIIRDKFLLFSTALGGSFMAAFTKAFPVVVEYGLFFVMAFSAFGLFNNLKKAGTILWEIKEMKRTLNG